MQLIPKSYSHGGRTFERIKRNDVAAIYQCSDGKIGYEVHQIRIAAAGEYMGRQLPEREVLATSREWGEFGWSYMLSDYKGALKRFNNVSSGVESTIRKVCLTEGGEQ